MAKLWNEYAGAFPDYATTPKAVIAAIALSLAKRLSEDSIEAACSLLVVEWDILYDNGIVPQKRKMREIGGENG